MNKRFHRNSLLVLVFNIIILTSCSGLFYKCNTGEKRGSRLSMSPFNLDWQVQSSNELLTQKTTKWEEISFCSLLWPNSPELVFLFQLWQDLKMCKNFRETENEHIILSLQVIDTDLFKCDFLTIYHFILYLSDICVMKQKRKIQRLNWQGNIKFDFLFK